MLFHDIQSFFVEYCYFVDSPQVIEALQTGAAR